MKPGSGVGYGNQSPKGNAERTGQGMPRTRVPASVTQVVDPVALVSVYKVTLPNQVLYEWFPKCHRREEVKYQTRARFPGPRVVVLPGCVGQRLGHKSW